MRDGTIEELAGKVTSSGVKAQRVIWLNDQVWRTYKLNFIAVRLRFLKKGRLTYDVHVVFHHRSICKLHFAAEIAVVALV